MTQYTGTSIVLTVLTVLTANEFLTVWKRLSGFLTPLRRLAKKKTGRSSTSPTFGNTVLRTTLRTFLRTFRRVFGCAFGDFERCPERAELTNELGAGSAGEGGGRGV